MASIPLVVLLKIETQRPDLAPLINDLMASADAGEERVIEQRLATNYMAGAVDLTAEESLSLSACCTGKKYADVR